MLREYSIRYPSLVRKSISIHLEKLFCIVPIGVKVRQYILYATADYSGHTLLP